MSHESPWLPILANRVILVLQAIMVTTSVLWFVYSQHRVGTEEIILPVFQVMPYSLHQMHGHVGCSSGTQFQLRRQPCLVITLG